MQLNEQLMLAEIFEHSAAVKRQTAWLIEEDLRFVETQRVEKHHKKEERDLADQMAATERAAFLTRLETYDTAVVEALMDNESALERVRKEREKMLSGAYTLPNGRKVFKSEDGVHVFDQDGRPVSADRVVPDAIPDGLPRWEGYKAGLDAEHKLIHERHELLDYQKKVDAARDKVDKGATSRDDLDGIDADLKRAMPEAVRQKLGSHVPGQDPTEPKPPGPPAPGAGGVNPQPSPAAFAPH